MKIKFDHLGKLMNRNQELLSTLNVSSRELDRLIAAAVDHGAYGAKLSGAGGGDCMIAFAPEDRIDGVGKAIEKAGGTWMKVKTGAVGIKLDNE